MRRDNIDIYVDNAEAGGVSTVGNASDDADEESTGDTTSDSFEELAGNATGVFTDDVPGELIEEDTMVRLGGGTVTSVEDTTEDVEYTVTAVVDDSGTTEYTADEAVDSVESPDVSVPTSDKADDDNSGVNSEASERDTDDIILICDTDVAVEEGSASIVEETAFDRMESRTDNDSDSDP
jgi:hypothetical protein